ncbi:hypothetical protein BDW59DRAFT_182353 [Aspergillus cavernicola]|uniref:PBP domain-containing protein n=1 Tax=Aspergillus cavernicola TaxID=176166 RepID=A0ABR4HNG2_9EURO
MSFYQLAVVDHECYLLLTDGSVKQYIRDGKENWKEIITKNGNNIQIAARNVLGIRQRNGDLWTQDSRRVTKSIGNNAAKLWADNNKFWQWQQDSGKLYYERPETNGKWEYYGTKPLTKDLVFVRGVGIFHLAEDGKISQHDIADNWNTISSSTTNKAIAADRNSLYTLDGTKVEVWSGKSWTKIDGNPINTQIAGGDAGLFLRQKNGAIWRYDGSEKKWSRIFGEATGTFDSVHIAAASSAYRVNSKGEIFIYRDNERWDRIKGEDPHPSPPTHTGVEPAAVYNGGYGNTAQILLRIGNGAAGQSGLIEALANAYINSKVAKGDQPFRIAWYKSDTTESINYLKDGTADLAITYTEAAENLAIEQGIAVAPRHYIFREHFLLAGPHSNPAKLDPKADILHQISTLYTAAEAGNTTPPVRFLSRYDKSATSIKDSELWIKIGQIPWAMKYSNWYHQFIAYPIQALSAAATLQEYTLTDFGTYLSVDETVRKQLTIFKRGQDDPTDLLLMPAHLLVGANAQDLTLAKDFAAWATGKEGQAVIANFTKISQKVYSPAP